MNDARQEEIPGTERKLSKKIRKLGEAHASAINEHTQAAVKKRDTKLALIAQMLEEKIERYRDTEITPPIDVKCTLEPKLVIKKYRPPHEENELPVEAHRKLDPRATKKSTPEG